MDELADEEGGRGRTHGDQREREERDLLEAHLCVPQNRQSLGQTLMHVPHRTQSESLMTGSFQIRFDSFSPGFGSGFGMSSIVMQFVGQSREHALHPMHSGGSSRIESSFAGRSTRIGFIGSLCWKIS